MSGELDSRDATLLLGELKAGIASLGRSVDQLRTDGATRDGALDAKITEVANQQRAALVANTQLGERLENHIRVDETNHSTVLEEIKEVTGKLNDLLTWRGKLLGGMAVVGILISIFGHTVAEWVGTAWHALFK